MKNPGYTIIAFALLFAGCGTETPKAVATADSAADSSTVKTPPPVPAEKLDPNDTLVEWKRTITLPGPFYDFAVFKNGRIAARTNEGDALISLLSADGKRIRAFGKKGRSDSTFRNGPDHIALSPDGIIYSNDGTEPRILAFDSSGHYLRTLNVGGGQMVAGLTVNSKGEVLVSLATGWMIKRFDATGKFMDDNKNIKSQGGKMWGYLANIGVDSADRTYLCNWRDIGANGAAVHISDASGAYLETLADFHIDHGTVVSGYDACGRIYMENGESINIYNNKGKKLCSFGTKGKGDGQFDKTINSIQVTPAGYIYVLEMGSERLQVFR